MTADAATEQTETIRNISNMYSSIDHELIQYSWGSCKTFRKMLYMKGHFNKMTFIAAQPVHLIITHKDMPFHFLLFTYKHILFFSSARPPIICWNVWGSNNPCLAHLTIHSTLQGWETQIPSCLWQFERKKYWNVLSIKYTHFICGVVK